MRGFGTLVLGGLTVFGSASAQYAAQRPLVSEQPTGNDKPKSKPLVDSASLQDLIRGDQLLTHAENLYSIAQLSEDEYKHRTRVIGSSGHLETLSYITSQFTDDPDLASYYTLSRQPFPAVSGNVFSSYLIINSSTPQSAQPMSLTPPTKSRSPVNGSLILIANDGCQPSDYPSTTAGNIALIRRGTCPFGAKSALAGQAGALAAVVYNSDLSSADPFSGTLGSPSPYHVATFGLSGTDAAPLVQALSSDKATPLPAAAYMDAIVQTVTTHNLIAQTRGGDPDNCVMLGGHSDSVSEGPGINDDGSGAMSVLEVARQLGKHFTVANCVRFAWWSAEEEGLLGSDWYVDQLSAEENGKIRVFMDYDMLASPNFAYQVYDARNGVKGVPEGSQELRDLYVAWYEAQGVNYTFVEFDGRSDYDGFIRHGIPAGGIATGAEGIKTEEEVGMFGGRAGEQYDPCYHLACDGVGNVNVTAWELNTKLVAHSVATFARSFDGFPERIAPVAAKGVRERRTRHRGSKLLI